MIKSCWESEGVCKGDAEGADRRLLQFTVVKCIRAEWPCLHCAEQSCTVSQEHLLLAARSHEPGEIEAYFNREASLAYCSTGRQT